jgi:hypothetical protein
VELAQLICKRSSELYGDYSPEDVGDAALNLVRTAGQDEAEPQHASVIFQTRLRADPADAASQDGLRLLTRVIAFLG